MIRINLLPFRAARKKENIRRQVSIFFLGLICVVLGLFAGNYLLGLQVNGLKEDIKKTESELKKYNEINEEIKRIKKTLENLQKKMDVINRLEFNRHAGVRLLDTLTQVIPKPKKLWLTRLEEKDNSIKIDGIAMDEQEVADFMRELQKCGLFKSVDLKTLKHKEVEKKSLKYFQVACNKITLEKPSEKPEEEDGKSKKKRGKKAKT